MKYNVLERKPAVTEKLKAKASTIMSIKIILMPEV